jgi:hypothetical protein
MRTTLRLLLVVCLLSQLIAPALARAEEAAAAQSGVVTADRLNLREGAGTDYAVVGSAAKGETVTILEESEGWFRVRLEDGRTGWAAARYVEIQAAAEAETPAEEPRGDGPAASPEPKAKRSSGGGGSALRGVLKWGSFFGAAACGGLAYNENSQGDDSYEQYRTLIEEDGQTPTQAEFRRQEAIDHDDKANTFMIAGGALFGAFLIQQFFFHGSQDDQATLESDAPAVSPGRLIVTAAPRGWKAGLVLARF